MTGSSDQSHGDSIAIRRFALGPFQTNCYVIAPRHKDAPPNEPSPGAPCWIVDASFEPDALIRDVQRLRLRPQRLILTHAHVDHIAGVDEVLAALGPMPVALHAAEREWLSDPSLNLSIGLGEPLVVQRKPNADETLVHGQQMSIGKSVWNVLHTPGHSPGSVTLHCVEAGVAIVGDTLFAGSIGRTDFPTSDHEALVASIKNVLYALPDETIVHPGHGPSTTIAKEKRSNPFVRA